MPTPLVQVTGLTKRFGERIAVDGVSFTVSPGECYGLLGPNGAGKTTTISLLCGLCTPDAGTVRIGGQDPAGDAGATARRLLGYAPQQVALFPDLSIRQNVEFWARMNRVERRARRSRIDAVLELVGLADRADDTVETCSGGMQRRANLAVALVHQPALLVLDEPTVGVDPQSRNRLLSQVREIISAGTAIIYTSHYVEEVQRLADRVGIMDHGVLVAEGTVQELLHGSPGPAQDLEQRFLELTGTALRD